jgi:hypothetical protein
MRNEGIQAAPERAPARKRAYTSPTLKTYDTLEALTLNVIGAPVDGNVVANGSL